MLLAPSSAALPGQSAAPCQPRTQSPSSCTGPGRTPVSLAEVPASPTGLAAPPARQKCPHPSPNRCIPAGCAPCHCPALSWLQNGLKKRGAVGKSRRSPWSTWLQLCCGSAVLPPLPRHERRCPAREPITEGLKSKAGGSWGAHSSPGLTAWPLPAPFLRGAGRDGCGRAGDAGAAGAAG